MDRDMMVERGNRAAALLDHPPFREVVQCLANEYADTFLTSKPSDSALREDVYHRNRALQDLVGVLGAWRDARDEQLRKEYEERVEAGEIEPEKEEIE